MLNLIMRRTTANSWATFLQYSLCALKNKAVEPAALISRMFYFSIMLFIFSKIWIAAYSNAVQLKWSSREMIWYLAIAEWIFLSIPFVHLEIEKDLRNSNFDYYLLRPFSYLKAKLADGLGMLFFRSSSLLLIALWVAYLLGGAFPRQPFWLILVVLLGFLSCGVCLFFNILIGLSAFWVKEVTSLQWLWAKSSLFFGGIIIPLELYPAWVSSISKILPFSALFHGVAILAISGDYYAFLRSLLLLISWGTLAIISMLAFFKLGIRRVLSGEYQ